MRGSRRDGDISGRATLTCPPGRRRSDHLHETAHTAPLPHRGRRMWDGSPFTVPESPLGPTGSPRGGRPRGFRCSGGRSWATGTQIVNTLSVVSPGRMTSGREQSRATGRVTGAKQSRSRRTRRTVAGRRQSRPVAPPADTPSRGPQLPCSARTTTCPCARGGWMPTSRGLSDTTSTQNPMVADHGVLCRLVRVWAGLGGRLGVRGDGSSCRPPDGRSVRLPSRGTRGWSEACSDSRIA
jgi:hypothetical protein